MNPLTFISEHHRLKFSIISSLDLAVILLSNTVGFVNYILPAARKIHLVAVSDDEITVQVSCKV